MCKTHLVIVATTVRASKMGLERVEEARCAKGWSKLERAWIDQASTSVATLKRFWSRVPIRSRAFQSICEVVGIDDWASIVDIDNLSKPSPQISGKRLLLSFAFSFEELDGRILDRITALLQELSEDFTIEILDIDDGNIKLILGGSSEGLERIEALFKSGELADVLDKQLEIRVDDVHFFEKREFIQLIFKNGGGVMDLRKVDLSFADLIRVELWFANLTRTILTGAVLTGAVLIGAVLIKANLTGAVLIGASLQGANLRGAFLWEANLTGANLTEANLTGANLTGANLERAILLRACFGNNEGLTEAEKADYKLRGAVFVDEPHSNVSASVEG